MGKTSVFGIRLTPELAAKLDRLAIDTNRSKGQIVRWLLERAETTGAPDIRFAQQPGGDSGAKGHDADD